MKIKNKLDEIITNIVKILFAFIILLLLITSINFSCSVDIDEYTSYDNDSIIKNIAYIIISVFVCLGIALVRAKNKKINAKNFITKKYVYVIATICIIFSLIWIVSAQLAPRADQFYILRASLNMANGNFEDFEQGGYLYINPSQSGIVLFLYLLGNIVGKYNYVAIQLLNLLALIISYYYIYASYKLIFYSNEEKEKKNEKNLIVIGLFLFIQMLFYTTFVYGNIFGLMFSVIAIYFELNYLKNKKIYRIIISFICIVLATIIKMNYLITMIAMIILLIYKALFKSKYTCLLWIIGLIIIYIGGNKLIENSIKNITDEELTDGIPMLAYIEMGLQDGGYASGWYNKYNVKVLVENDYDTEKTKEVVKADLKKTLTEFSKDINGFFAYMNRKIVSQWTNPTFQCFWINQNRETIMEIPKWQQDIIDGNGMYNILVKYMDMMQTLILFGTLMYIIVDFKKINFEHLFFAIVFIGGFLFHLIWEAKCQYTLTYFILIIPYFVKGYSVMIENLKEEIENTSKKG